MLLFISILVKRSMLCLTPKLLARLHSYGIRGMVLSWLKNFFTGRTHQTKIETTLSDTGMAVLLSGVVQGSGINRPTYVSGVHK